MLLPPLVGCSLQSSYVIWLQFGQLLGFWDSASLSVHQGDEIEGFIITVLLDCVLVDIGSGFISSIHKMQWLSTRLLYKSTDQLQLELRPCELSQRSCYCPSCSYKPAGAPFFSAMLLWLLPPSFVCARQCLQFQGTLYSPHSKYSHKTTLLH